jgi:hypothetical protein
LPSYLTCDTKNLITMERNENRNKYEDNLCFFRCLQHFLNGDHIDKKVLRDYYKRYRSRVNGTPMEQFDGLPEAHLPWVEVLFDITIQIFPQNIEESNHMHAESAS